MQIPVQVTFHGMAPSPALDAAIRKALGPAYPAVERMTLLDYKVRVINAQEGTAAKVRVSIESTDGETVWGTVGVSENVIEASWLALADAFTWFLGQALQSARRGITWEKLITNIGARIKAQGYAQNPQLVCPQGLRNDKIPRHQSL